MSPKDRDRAREKRRYEKRQSVLEKRELDRQRNRQVIGVVLAVVVVVGGLVGLSLALGNDKGTPAAGQAPTATATPTPTRSTGPAPSPTSSAPAAAPKPVAGCSAVPKAPGERKATLPDKATAAGKTWVGTITTTCGVIEVELDGVKAPQTVASFLGLAKTGYWANSPCHRLTGASDGIFVLQCGDPTGTGNGGPGYGFGVENAPKDFQYPAGTLAMARTQDPNTNGGQFFIVYKQTTLQDNTGYSIFGRVTKGLDIVNKVAAAGISAASAPAPSQPISILKVAVTEKRV